MNGDLDGQDSWVLDASADASLVIALGPGNGATSDTTATQANVRTIAGFNPTQAWQLSADVEYAIPVGDGGGSITVMIGDSTGDSVGSILDFTAGDGALNQVTTVHAFDASVDNTAGPAAFPSGTANTLTITYTGSNLQVRINGTLIVSIIGVVIGTTPNKLLLSGVVSIATNAMKFANVTLTQ